MNTKAQFLGATALIVMVFANDGHSLREDSAANIGPQSGLALDVRSITQETSDDLRDWENATSDELCAKAFEHFPDPNEAAKWFQRAIQKNPDDADAYAGMAAAYAFFEINPTPTSYYEKAVEAARKAVQLRPDSAYAYFSLGRAYRGLHRNREAVDCLRTLTRLRPDSCAAMWELAGAYYDLGRWTAARHAVEKEIRLKAQTTEVNQWGGPRTADDYWDYMRLGELYQKAGNYELAYADYEEVAVIAPNDLEVREQLGHEFLKMGYKAAAINEYDALASLCAQDKYAESDGCFSRVRRLEAEIIKH
ncbi:MAG TPA: tetratricopeptide repeat protein [Blastocatellia bacterium]|nr:tetratricopeptide repeat protein [Blastocatellia bacterium]